MADATRGNLIAFTIIVIVLFAVIIGVVAFIAYTMRRKKKRDIN